MRSRSQTLAALVFCAAAMIHPNAAQASPPSYFPSYLLVRPGATSGPRHSAHGAYPGYGIPLSAPSYSYGWFGARSKPHATFHQGYYGNYSEWSRQ